LTAFLARAIAKNGGGVAKTAYDKNLANIATDPPPPPPPKGIIIIIVQATVRDLLTYGLS